MKFKDIYKLIAKDYKRIEKQREKDWHKFRIKLVDKAIKEMETRLEEAK